VSISTQQTPTIHVLKRWSIFISERFPLIDHLLMIALLVIGNALVARHGMIPNILSIIPAFAIIVFFFFRLRCFDEIKDYQTDCDVNPTRPLPRGLLSINEVKWMIGILTVLEIAMMLTFFPTSTSLYILAVAYSYLMYKEFFIGAYLSPHLTTYAITHTFVSALVACTIFTMFTSYELSTLPKSLWLYAGVTWALFNVFEFARKSYAPAEERKNVTTYTSQFGIKGAVLLSLSQLLVAVAIPYFLVTKNIGGEALFTESEVLWQCLLAVTILFIGLYFIQKKTVFAAKLFRTACTLYLIAYLSLLIALKVF